MVKKEDPYIQTSIRVPRDRYAVLEEIKGLEGTPINALVVEAIDFLIKDRYKELEENLNKKTAIVRSVLDSLKE